MRTEHSVEKEGGGEESEGGRDGSRGRERKRKRQHCKQCNPSETSRGHGGTGLHKECGMDSRFFFFLFFLDVKGKSDLSEERLGD